MKRARLAVALALCCLPSMRAQVPDAPAIALPSVTNPAGVSTSLENARELMAQGSFQKAEAMVRDYLANQPHSAQAHTLLAYCLLRQNHPKEALAEYTLAAQSEHPTAEDLKNVAQAYTLLGDNADAVKWGSRAVELDPENPDAWYSLGRIHYTGQRFDAAAACFRKTLALVPRSVKAANNLGLALEGLNRSDEAVAAYRQAIAWGDADGQVAGMEQPLLNLSIVLLHRGELDQALPLLKRASSIAPRDPNIHEQLGHLYLQHGNLREAEDEFENSLSLDPANAALHFLLGQTYRRQGLNEKAQAEFARAAAMMGTRSSQP